jgi:hypothetical protein
MAPAATPFAPRASRSWDEELSHLDDPTWLDNENLQAVLEFWRAKRAELGRLPRRADIDPNALRSHLGRLFLIDVLPGAADFRFRLIGSKLAHRYGRDSTGKLLTECFPGESRPVGEWLRGCYRTVALRKIPVLTRAPLVQTGREFTQAVAIHMPLSEDGEQVNMIFGSTEFDTAG